MKTLIVEDDYTSRRLLEEMLGAYGPVHIAVNGREAIDAVEEALNAGQPYHLICLDIMMPEMDGQEALRRIRDMEEEKDKTFSLGAKIIMTSALDDLQNKIKAFSGLCDIYLTKPIHKEQLLGELRKLDLI